MNKLQIRSLIPAVALCILLCLAAACGQDEPQEMTFTTPLTNIDNPTADTGETPSPPSTPAFDISPAQPSTETSLSTKPPPEPVMLPLSHFTPTPIPTATPSRSDNTTLTPTPQDNATDSTPDTLATGTEQSHVFPTPDLPEGIGAPPVPPSFPVDQTPRPTRTPLPTVPITFELAEDDPINSAPWYQDGLHQIELDAIHLLREIADPNNITVEDWLAMPAFRTSIESSDINALKSLITVKRINRIAFWYTMLHPTIKTGIYDDWTHIIAALPGSITKGGETSPQPRIISQLLNPATVSMELDNLTLTSGQTIQLAIIRTTAGDANSMQRLKDAITRADERSTAPFPEPHVVLLFAQWPDESPIGGQFHNSSITISHRFDVGLGSPDGRNSDHLMERLVTRYYPSATSEAEPSQEEPITPTITLTITPTINWLDLLPATLEPAPTVNPEGG